MIYAKHDYLYFVDWMECLGAVCRFFELNYTAIATRIEYAAGKRAFNVVHQEKLLWR